MKSETDPLAEFRHLVSRRAHQFPIQWEQSKRLIEKNELSSTLAQLLRMSREKELPATIKESLCAVLGQKQAQRVQDLAPDLN